MIRAYKPDDKKEVAKIISESRKCVCSLELYLFNIFSDMASDSSFVCVEGGSIAGFIGALAFDSQKTLFMYSLATGKGFRRNGIPIYLFESLIIHSYKIGYKRISFPINHTNYLNCAIVKKVADRLNLPLKKTSTDQNNIYMSPDLFSEDIYTLFLKK